jgi:thiol-disulfide isomerase/thioredoxin
MPFNSDAALIAASPQAVPARRTFMARATTLLAAASLATRGTSAQAASLQVGSPAPALTLSTIDGRKIDTRSMQGRVLILTFWATWCEPCRLELPLLSQFAEAHRGDGLEVLGFSLDSPSDMSDVRQVASKLSFPVGLLGSAYAGGYGRVWHLPVNFTIDRAGRLADNGWDDDNPTWTEQRLNKIVLPLLRQEPSANQVGRT